MRKHAHRESGPSLSDDREGSNPLESLNSGGCYSHKKTNARVFFCLSSLFFELIVRALRFPYSLRFSRAPQYFGIDIRSRERVGEKCYSFWSMKRDAIRGRLSWRMRMV